MPTIFREGPYRVFFWAQDRLTEPPHVHVERDDHNAKLWLEPVRIERAGGIGAGELRRIFRLITDN